MPHRTIQHWEYREYTSLLGKLFTETPYRFKIIHTLILLSALSSDFFWIYPVFLSFYHRLRFAPFCWIIHDFHNILGDKTCIFKDLITLHHLYLKGLVQYPKYKISSSVFTSTLLIVTKIFFLSLSVGILTDPWNASLHYKQLFFLQHLQPRAFSTKYPSKSTK